MEDTTEENVRNLCEVLLNTDHSCLGKYIIDFYVLDDGAVVLELVNSDLERVGIVVRENYVHLMTVKEKEELISTSDVFNEINVVEISDALSWAVKRIWDK